MNKFKFPFNGNFISTKYTKGSWINSRSFLGLLKCVTHTSHKEVVVHPSLWRSSRAIFAATWIYTEIFSTFSEETSKGPCAKCFSSLVLKCKLQIVTENDSVQEMSVTPQINLFPLMSQSMQINCSYVGHAAFMINKNENWNWKFPNTSSNRSFFFLNLPKSLWDTRPNLT